MGDLKDQPYPGAAGPSAVKGTFRSMKKLFYRLLTANSGRQGLQAFGEEVMQEWGELSGKLDPGSNLEERASALAFVVRQCYRLLNTYGFEGKQGVDDGHKALVQSILGVLHGCMDDLTDYKPMPRNCFEFYGDCLAAMEVFTKRAWSLHREMGSDAGALVSLASHLQFEIKQATGCMSRCWSVLRSKDGTLMASPRAIAADMRNQISELDDAKTADDPADLLMLVEVAVKEFCKLGLSFICVLSCNMLEGMGTMAEIHVDKQASDEAFNDCKKLLGFGEEALDEKFIKFKELLGVTDDAQRAEASLKSLGGIFNLVSERRDYAITIADLQNTKGAKETPNKKQVNEKLKMRLGSGTSSSTLKSVAAELLSSGHGELLEIFSDVWGSDIERGHNSERDHFADSASCTLFSLAPFTYAMATLLRFWADILRPDAAGAAKVEERTYVEDMNIMIKSRNEKNLAELLQDSTEGGKKTEGNSTPRKRAGPQPSSPVGPGRENTSIPELTSKYLPGSPSQKSAMVTTEGTLKCPEREAEGGLEEVGDSKVVGEHKDGGGPGNVGNFEDAGGAVGENDNEGNPDNGNSEESGEHEGEGDPDNGNSEDASEDEDEGPTPEELEQAKEAFVNGCGIPDVEVLLQNIAEVEEYVGADIFGDGNLGDLSEAIHLLGLSRLYELGLHFSTGRNHPDPKLDRFTTDLPELVEFLAGLGLEGPFASSVADMRHQFHRAQVLAVGVTSVGDDATTRHLYFLGFYILMFTIAACNLSKALLQNPP